MAQGASTDKNARSRYWAGGREYEGIGVRHIIHDGSLVSSGSTETALRATVRHVYSRNVHTLLLLPLFCAGTLYYCKGAAHECEISVLQKDVLEKIYKNVLTAPSFSDIAVSSPGYRTRYPREGAAGKNEPAREKSRGATFKVGASANWGTERGRPEVLLY